METREIGIQNAGGVVLNVYDKLVLVEQQGNSWSLPKGGIEAGESPLEAAVREIREETGITALTLVAELGHYVRRSFNKEGTGMDMTQPATLRAVFLFRTEETLLKIDGKEITDARWVTIDEALGLLTHQEDKKFLASVRGRIEECLK